MKISKVDHMKTCISIQKDSSGQTSLPGTGMLYKYPPNRNKNTDIKSHITGQLNDNAKKLYSLFIPCKIEDHQERIAFKHEKNFFNAWAKKYLIKKSDDVPTLSDEQKKEIKNYSSKDIISSFINRGLRNSLRRNVRPKDQERIYVPEILTQMMFLAIAGKNEEEIRRELKSEIFDKVAEFVKEDYTKEERIEKITKSIKKKNTKVQVVDREDKTVLQLSNAEHEKKKYIFEFIKEYAASGEEHQKQMLIHIRKLIVAFFCGEDVYNNADVLEWSFGDIELDDSKNFSTEAIELITQIAQTPKQNKAEKRKLADDLKNKIRDEVASHYHKAIEIPNIKENNANLFWIQYFERFAEKELQVRDSLHPGKLSIRFLCNTAWKEWISFIAMKYVDMGKAVYHFAMPNLENISGQKPLKIGLIPSGFRNGISSFAYERITAKESLERDLSRYIAFAVNNFSKTVCSEEFRAQDGKEDILQVKNPKLLPNINHKILQYFGGASIWKDNKKIAKYTDKELFSAFREKFADLRNSTFHYTGKLNSACAGSNEIISGLLEQELSWVGRVYRKKYYSNNTLMFYKKSDITNLMTHLYNSYKVLPAQIPAFHNIINKENLKEIISELVEDNVYGQRDNITVNFNGAFYFILKEIYYHDFLTFKALPALFYYALGQTLPGEIQNKRALDNFRKRLKDINYRNLSFGEICQFIVTDYNQQNNDKKKHVSAKEKTIERDGEKSKTVKAVEGGEQKYKHFRSLLYLGIKKAFLLYLKKGQKFGKKQEHFDWPTEYNPDIFRFLWHPKYKADTYQHMKEDKFCSGWNCPMYNDLKERDEPILQSYYVCAHFLNPKYLNHMAGCIKNYIQYRNDIERRAESTEQPYENIQKEIEHYENIIKMLEFCLIFSGQVSHEWSDYFDTEDEYITYMGKFIQYENTARDDDVNLLKTFCNEEILIEPEHGKKEKILHKIGTYYDEINPILNRNIVMAKLYGDTKTVSACFSPITKNDFYMYYKESDDLEAVFLRGHCETAEEQARLRLYQNYKNRIEMIDIRIYSELINDLLGQLISLAYLRERDLMYLQIGYYYIKLYHTDSIPKNHWMRQLHGDTINITDGAILYQIAAMYTYELPVYELKDNIAYAPAENTSTGSNVSRFLNSYCQGNLKSERDSIYLAGLCFFENVNRHDELIELRNYIDHFKYFIKNDQSILELYSQFYDSFLAYDTKLKKSVTYTLKNILLQYFVDAKITMFTNNNNNSNHITDIHISEDALSSDYFTYKIKAPKKNKPNFKKNIFVKVREDLFMKQLREILIYKK